MGKASSAASGALGGAGTGAMVGSAIPGIGTVIGAGVGGLVGGLAGYFGSSDDSAQMPNIVDPVTGQMITDAQGNVQSGLTQQQNFVNALQAQNGIGNQSQVYNQLQGVVDGTGPNPAQAALAQATQANVANQSAMAAGQRGAAQNVGMMARGAANQGAAIQQQAIGQGATMQAQQSLAAMSAAGNMANQQVNQQGQALGNYNQFAQGNQNAVLGARTAYNNAMTSGQGNVNNNNQAASAQDAKQIGGALNGLGGAAAAFAGAEAGGSPMTDARYKMPEMGASQPAPSQPAPQGPSLTGGVLKYAEGGPVNGPRSQAAQHLNHGGKVNAMVSPGEAYLKPGQVNAKDPLKAAQKIPGQPNRPGDSLANDTVPKKLEEGGVVIPNSVMQSKDPHAAAAAFVAHILGKKGLRK